MAQDQSSHRQLRALDGRVIPYAFDPPRHGAPTKGAYLLLHGLGVDKDEYLGFYRRLSRKLSDAGFGVLRIDFPGHGESAHAGDFNLVSCIADSLVAAKFAMELLGVNRLRVFGTSFGAGPAVVAASFYSDRLDCLTLLAPAISYQELYISPENPGRKARYGRFFRGAIERGETVFVSQTVQLGWRAAIEFSVFDIMRHLGVVADRSVIIHGMSDSLVPVQFSVEIADKLPAVVLELMPGMDHGFMDESDEEGTGALSDKNFEFICMEALR